MFNTKDLKKEALEHYDRMIAWAKTKKDFVYKVNPLEYPGIDSEIDKIKLLMRRDILDSTEEMWYDYYCPYCREFSDEDGSCWNDEEIECPLNSDYGCCNGLWEEMNECTDWKSWVIAAKKVREYIRRNG